jgi:predicted transcriptional regulator
MPQKKKKPKTKIRYVEVNATEKSFVSKLIGVKPSHDFSDVKFLKSILSNEKARILHTLKHENPKSIYALAKFLGRDIKSVNEDVRLLERFGFIEFHAEKTGKRGSLMPVLTVDKIQIIINI